MNDGLTSSGVSAVNGAIVSIYLPINTQTAKILWSVPMANVPFFAVALISSIIIAVASGSQMERFRKIGALPLWLLTAGVMSAGMIIRSSYLIPRIGIGAFFALLVSGQVLVGMVFSCFGMFGASACTQRVT